MTTVELVQAVRSQGGLIEERGGSLHCELPRSLSGMVEELRRAKLEILECLKSECWWRSPSGERETVFPSCPACGSYALWREHPGEPYECLTCTTQGIPEAEARKQRVS